MRQLPYPNLEVAPTHMLLKGALTWWQCGQIKMAGFAEGVLSASLSLHDFESEFIHLF